MFVVGEVPRVRILAHKTFRDGGALLRVSGGARKQDLRPMTQNAVCMSAYAVVGKCWVSTHALADCVDIATKGLNGAHSHKQ